MIYERTYWEDSPSSTTPLSADNLNKIETGLYEVTEAITDLETNVGKKLPDVENSVQASHITAGAITSEKLEEAVQQEIKSISTKATSSLFLKQSNKQLIKLADLETEIDGLSITIKNNHVHLKGVATSNITSWIACDVRLDSYLTGVSYTASAQNVITHPLSSGATQNNVGLRLHYGSVTPWQVVIGNSTATATFTPTSDITGDKAKIAWNIMPGEYDKEFDFMLELGSAMTAFEPYYVVSNIETNSVSLNKLTHDLQAEISAIKTKANASDVNGKISYYKFEDITNDIGIESGYYYGQFTHNSETAWECTATPIPCKEGDIFRYSATAIYNDGRQQTVKCYDSNKTLVGEYNGSTSGVVATYTDKVFVVPEGVAYIAFNCWTREGKQSLEIAKATPIYDVSTQIASGLLDNTASTLYGKSMYSDGDSIAQGSGSYGVSYAHLLRDKYNMTLTSEAVGGTTLAVQSGRTDSIYERITSMTGDYDVILFEGGTNDVTQVYKGNLTVGEITDSFDPANFDTSTVLGALEGICCHLNTNYFEAQKLFIFVNARVDEYFALTNEIFNEMKTVLEKWGIPYVDIAKVSNLGNWTSTVAGDYFASDTDRLHPSLKGYKKFYLPYIDKALICGGYINT